MLMTIEEQVSDWELVLEARGGNVDAFAALVRRHQTAALRVATVALGSPDDADDVTQEAFVKAHRALDQFRAEAPFAPWLFRIVRNTAFNRHRHRQRQSALTLRAGAQVETPAALPDEVVTQKAESTALITAINRLSPDDRLILTHRWFHEMSEAEIATALGCPAGTVKSRLHRALGRLRTELTNEGSRP